MKINTTLNKNILYLSLVQGSSYILPLVTFPYLVRVLGPESFGLLGFCQASMQYLVLLTDYGYNLTASQQISINRGCDKKINEIFWSVTFSKIFLAVLAFSLLSVVCMIVPKYKQMMEILLAFSPLVIGNILYPIWFFQGMEKMKSITLCTISARCLVIPMTFIFVDRDSSIWIAALVQSSVNLLAGALSCLLIIKYKWVSGFEFNIEKIKHSLYDGWHVFLSTSAISLYTTSTTVILGFMSGATAVGYFNAANTIRNAAQGILNPITQAIYPRINSLYGSNYKQAFLIIQKSLYIVGGLSFVGSMLLLTLSPWVIRIGLGENYNEAISVLRWMSFLPFLITLSNIFGVQTMLTHGYKKQFSRILMSSGILNVTLIFPFVFFFSADGAAISMLITEFFVTIVMFFFLRYKKINLFKKVV